jgi:flagellin
MSGFGSIDSLAGMAGMMMQAVDQRMADAVRRISSGLAAQNAGDGPAQMALSEGLQRRIQGLDTAISSNNNNANMIKTADGGLGQVQDTLSRMRTAAVAAANTQDPAVRAAYQAEIQTAMAGLQAAADNTQFGDKKLLDGSARDMKMALGQDGQTVTASMMDVSPDQMGTDVSAQGVAGVDVTTQQGAQDAIKVIDSAMARVSDQRADLGSIQSNLIEPNTRALQVEKSNLSASVSSVRDTDMTQAMTGMVVARMQMNAGLAMLAQAGNVSSNLLTLLGR